jgi:hypothetical protein
MGRLGDLPSRGDRRMRTIVAALMLMAALAVPTLSYSGFCLPEGRFLTDQEIIDIGARDYFQRYPPPNYAPKDGSYVEVVRPIAYGSFDDFMLRNPNCCLVTQTGRDDGAPSLFHRLIGRFAGFARIEYQLEDSVHGAAGKNLVWVAVTNCGKPWNGVYWGH